MKKDILPLGVRTLLIPAGLLSVLVLVFAIGIRIGSAQIGQRRTNLVLLQKNRGILTAKRDLLTDIAPEVTARANLVTVALPGKNPALSAISQIKNLAGANGVFISGFKIGIGAQAGAKATVTEIGFEAAGPVGSILSLVSGIKKMAPITHIDRVELNLTGDYTQSSLQVRSYWAPYPTKMPALTEPASDLTKAEVAIVETLLDLTLPAFVTLVPDRPVDNPNPFGE